MARRGSPEGETTKEKRQVKHPFEEALAHVNEVMLFSKSYDSEALERAGKNLISKTTVGVNSDQIIELARRYTVVGMLLWQAAGIADNFDDEKLNKYFSGKSEEMMEISASFELPKDANKTSDSTPAPAPSTAPAMPPASSMSGAKS